MLPNKTTVKEIDNNFKEYIYHYSNLYNYKNKIYGEYDGFYLQQYV